MDLKKTNAPETPSIIFLPLKTDIVLYYLFVSL